MYTYNNLSNATIKYLYRFYEILDEMIYGMTSAKPTESISHTFIVQMIPHHLAAIRMSRNLLLYTTCIPLQNIAENIIISQTKSIHDMKKADLTCSKICNSNQELCVYLKQYEKITNEMFSQMADSKPSNNINISFMREMIPHHMGAVRMSKNALSYKICPELTPILESIIISQERGIMQMQRLLNNIRTSGC